MSLNSRTSSFRFCPLVAYCVLAIVCICPSKAFGRTSAHPRHSSTTATHTKQSVGGVQEDGEVEFKPVHLAKWYPFFDWDMNGRLSRIERVGWDQFIDNLTNFVNQNHQLDQFDVNGDGRLAGDETSRFVDKVTRDLALFDANGNGMLDGPEQASLEAFFKDPTGTDGPYSDVLEPESESKGTDQLLQPAFPDFNPRWSASKRQAYFSWYEAEMAYLVAQSQYIHDKSCFEAYQNIDHAQFTMFCQYHYPAPRTPDPTMVELARRHRDFAKRVFDESDG